MKVLLCAIAAILYFLGSLWWFSDDLTDHIPLLVTCSLGILGALAAIVAIALNGGTPPTKRNERRPYLCTLSTISNIILFITGLYALASAALGFWWPQ